jgi:organic radical activating enzyme
MNHGFKTEVDIDECRQWMLNWKDRIFPKNIGILGGEPFLSKNLKEYCYLTREMFPQCKIELVTNGFLLHLHEDLDKVLIENNIILSLSAHNTKDSSYVNIFKKKLETIKKWKDNGVVINLYKLDDNSWSKVYKGFGNNVEPYEDNNPELSWKHCPSGQICFQLHEGKLWKCAPLAYLPMMKEKYNLSEKWDPYLKYVALSHECTDSELKEFINKGAESYCGMCPSHPNFTKKNNPLLPVSYYEQQK